MILYCYELPPIDWYTCTFTKGQLMRSLADSDYEGHVFEHVCEMVDELTAAAERSFKLIGWEGDCRDKRGPRYFAVPGDGDMHIGCAIKQDNNGTTFIAAPCELLNLNEMTYGRRVVTSNGVRCRAHRIERLQL